MNRPRLLPADSWRGLVPGSCPPEDTQVPPASLALVGQCPLTDGRGLGWRSPAVALLQSPGILLAAGLAEECSP